MTNIVELMARALHTKEWEGQPGPEPFHIHKLYWLDAAQAAVQALKDAGYAVVPREPTEKMIKRGGLALAAEFTDPYDCLGPDFDSAFGIETSVTDQACDVMTDYVSAPFSAMIAAAEEE